LRVPLHLRTGILERVGGLKIAA